MKKTPTPISEKSGSDEDTEVSSSSLKDATNNDLKSAYDTLDCKDEKFYSNECNKFLLKKEFMETQHLSAHETENDFLYPNLNDVNFNVKIASKKEFNDTKYDGTIYDDIKKQADILANAEFELQPHQAFVKNFMSFQTPYSSLLLYHGLGSGKTCSAIGVCEEMRDYMKQMGITKRIIIVATENVQDNFKLQLFDERKLKLTDGIWNIRACTGNKLLKEINPMNMKGLPREKVINQIKSLINTYYIFLGYGQFANYIIKTMNYDEEVKRQREDRNAKMKALPNAKTKIQTLKEIKIDLNKRIMKRLQNEFNNRLIVIDEVHNIRKADDNENKKVAINLELLVKSAKNMRFLLLSATPMYNSYKEIIWLINLMNMNDRRGRIDVKDVFDKHGNFKENGKELLIRKATGYISFVRGENPYTFPYRVYPNEFAKEHTFPALSYPSRQMNLKKIKNVDKNRVLSLYALHLDKCNNCGKCQYCAYKYIIYSLRQKTFSITTKTGVVRDMPSFENMEKFGYTLLQTPLESLIISYPIAGLKEALDEIPADIINTKSSEFAPSLSESTSMSDDESGDEGAVGPVTKPETPIVKSHSSERKSAGEDDNLEIEDSPKSHRERKTTGSESESDISKKGGAGKMVIDPHKLTGKIGLERMMDFVDERSPPSKGEYAYKKSTLSEYGKIFSYEHIGKYSIKIKNVLDSIFDRKTGQVAEGVILIYSQYIDSGLVPMALALEEMGFIRYGDKGAKSLFKSPPTETVDVRTMMPKSSTPNVEEKKRFMPARYSVITGEPRLSPNNIFEVNGSTGEDNKDGHKVKVILISKAGSEGIDFKFVRQVHILEPWYNMNRIEQIIGRAVRNFSHKDLPFEKRNVQIFMYGTILGGHEQAEKEKEEEEAADLYVYRVAEYKAVQIGKVTRVLKQTAVDCIINHDQTNFTQEIMNASLKEPIKQELSTGVVLKDFKVGDAPFSPACDYMAKCNYDCTPDKNLEEALNEDTYNESFIVMNSEKILQRIRMLMKESYFYKKDILLKAIRTPKEYPYVQIYSALTHLIEDNAEFITDKYGRNGRLINIGDYYLFQPVELRDKYASIFDRSVPIDYKHDMIKFDIKQPVVKSALDKRSIGHKEVTSVVKEGVTFAKATETEKEPGSEPGSEPKPETEKEKEPEPEPNPEKDNNFDEGKRIIDEMIVNFELSRNIANQRTAVDRGDKDWYKHCGNVMRYMAIDYPDTKDHIISYLVAHMIEILMFNEKVEVMNYLYSLEQVTQGSFEWLAKQYFEEHCIDTGKFHVFIAYNLNKRVIMILDSNNTWIEAEPEDMKEIAMSKTVKEALEFKVSDYEKIVGFIGYEKSNKYMVFKTKDMTSTRDTGARCDEAGKAKIMVKMNEVLGETKYTNDTTKAKKDEKGKIVREAIGVIELCVIFEFMLRHFNNTREENNKKKCFLTPEMAIYHKLYKVHV